MKTLVVVVVLVFTFGCVSRNEVTRQKLSDYDLTCDELRREIEVTEKKKKEFEGDSGVTGENVVAVIAFWPGVFVNEWNADQNIDSAEDRLDHLNRLYREDCREKQRAQKPD